MQTDITVDVVVDQGRNGGMFARANSLAKAGVIARSYMNDPNMRKPEVGQRWRCRVVRDTCPGDEKQGVIVLCPVLQLPSREVFFINAKGSGEKFEVIVNLRVSRSELDVATLRRSVKQSADIVQTWPDDVRRLVSKLLGAQKKSQLHVLHGRTFQSQAAEVQRAERFVALPRWPRGTGPVAITVTAIEGDDTTRDITLSTGEIVHVAVGKDAAVKRGDRRKLEWDIAKKLQVGDVLSYEYPFQWFNDTLTNGAVWLPRECPRGPSRFKELGIAPVPKAGWELFLAGLEGQICANLLEYQERERAKSEAAKAAKRAPVLTPFQQQVRAVVQGRMWKGNETVEAVSVGAMLVFHARRQNGEKVYLVDNPGVGALFVFHDEDNATTFARGLMSRTEARNSGFQAIEHRPGWETLVEAVLVS